MSHVTKTATTDSECQCCLIDTPATLKCRTRGGNATLCGFSEYASPSTPAKKYRIQSPTGTLWKCEWLGGTCSTFGDTNCVSYSGTYVFAPSNCAETNTQDERVTSGAPGPPCGNCGSQVHNATPGINFAPTTFGLSNDGVLVTTQTTKTWTYGSGGCILPGSGNSRTFGGQVIATLTDEDTDADAISRLTTSGPGSIWTAFTTVGNGTGGTCINSVCCLARYQARTTGFTFIYQQAQARVEKTGLTPSKSYLVRLDVWRRAFGVNPYVLFQTLFVNATADGTGFLTVDIDVPNTVGFETYANSASIMVPR